jgi:hypothetical protein
MTPPYIIWGLLTTTSPSRISASTLGTPPLMSTIRLNRIDVKAEFIWTATAAAEFVPV